MKKAITFVSILTPVFFTVMWFAFPFLNNGLLNHMKSSLRLTEFVSSKMNILFVLRLKTAASFGVLPLVSFGMFILVRRTKNPEYAGRKKMLNLGFLIVAYVIGFFIKFQVLFSSLKYVDAHSIGPSIRFDKSIDSIYYYDYAVVFSLVAGLLLFLLSKRKRNNNQLLDEVS